MKFTEIYKTIPDAKAEFVSRICEITMTSRSSVYRWLSGEVVPPQIKRALISRELGIAEDLLFPDINEEKVQDEN